MKWTPLTWKSIAISMASLLYGIIIYMLTPHKDVGAIFLVGAYIMLISGVFIEGW